MQEKEEHIAIRVLTEQEKLAHVTPRLDEAFCQAIGNMAELQNNIQTMIVAVTNAMSNYEPIINQFSSMAQTIGDAIISTMSNIDFDGLTEAARKIAESLSDAIGKITIPTISEKRKSELIAAHKCWGEFGWTINPCAIETLFDTAPAGKKEADRLALKYCSRGKMEQIFSEIKQCKRVKKSDFEEATNDFQNRQYKSCALILFSLIEAKLIRLQKCSHCDNRGRKVGKKAVEAAKNRTEAEINTELLFTVLFYQNLFSCLSVVFQNGNDFRVQPKVINRNFLAHGMLTRNVTRKDCVQLFLLYYNVLELLDMVF